MNSKISNMLKLLIPLIIVILLFFGGVTTGIITFEKPKEKMEFGKVTATILIDFGNDKKYSEKLTLENSTGLEILYQLEKKGIILIETTYWESMDGYSVDSITFQDKKYESDTSHYWAFYVNGEASMKGGDKVFVKNNDEIEWRYVSF